MLHYNVNDYWDAKRKNEEEKVSEAARAEEISKHSKELGRTELLRQLESGELEAWSRANGFYDDRTPTKHKSYRRKRAVSASVNFSHPAFPVP